MHAFAQHQTEAVQVAAPDRRALLLGLGSLAAAQVLPSYAAKETAQVGEYLPPSDIPGFVEFVPDRKKVQPALKYAYTQSQARQITPAYPGHAPPHPFES